jgi:hypothetical protein
VRLLALLLLGACGYGTPNPHPHEIPSTIAGTPARAGTPTSDELVYFSTDESMRRLERSTHKVDFFHLANQFEGQEHGGMCGPTSAVIVLNTLRVPSDAEKPAYRAGFPEKYAPILDKLPPGRNPIFERYSQREFFSDPRVAGVKSEDRFYGAPGPDGKPDPGMQLRQLHDILLALGLTSEIHVVTDATTDALVRADLVANLGRADDYVVVNYSRKVLDQEGGGHISPLGAYDEASDSFLVLDVNPNRGKAWAWVPAHRLIAAMRTLDTTENRGYLLVRE